MDTSPAVDISDEEFGPDAVLDPYAFYGRMRDLDPVHWNRKYELWDVTSFDEVTWVTRNNDVFSSNFPKYDTRNRHAAIAPEDEHLYDVYRDHSARQLIRLDNPEHHPGRMVFHRSFTPRHVEGWRTLVREAVNQLLDEAEQRGGRIDVMHDLAEPLPVMVITSLLGIPYDKRPMIRELTPRLIPNAGQDPHRMRPFVAALATLQSYIEPVIEDRLANPTGDLMSAVAEGERQGVFSRDDSLANAALLIVAGHETTINLIANSVLNLIQYPDQWQLLRTDPAGLAGDATEELLRYEAPVKHLDRIAIQDVELLGRQIRSGDRVRYVISSANRDPKRFADPDRLDITRHANAHLTFGYGIHHCLGASLARVEGQEVIAGLASRYSSIQLLADGPDYSTDFVFRALRNLPVAFA